jgi:catechol 2,3-dioxygenase-like lactoylglutathione lyase family enzyme
VNIVAIAGFAVITEAFEDSRALYQDRFRMPFKVKDGYHYIDGFDGTTHFGIWPLSDAARACFGTSEWPAHIPRPQATIEYELETTESVQAAVRELQTAGQEFVHESRLEPWGQVIARFVSPEGLLIGLSYAPWLHQETAGDSA